MKVLSFKAKNLFSLGEVELDLRDRGLLLVTGHSMDEGGANGSGKSSLSNKGLLWTLFGSTAGGEKADAVVNRFHKEGEPTFGEVEFESASGGRFRINRGRNPNRLLLYDLDADKNISSTAEKDTQTTINRILGRNRDTFLQTDFFGQGKSAAFLDLTPKAQVDLLENILPFEKLGALQETAKHYLGRVKDVLQYYEAQVKENQGQLQECQRQERSLSGSIDQWEQKQLKRLADLTEQYESLKVTGEAAARMRELEKLLAGMTSPEDLSRMIDEANTEILGLNGYVKTYKDIISKIDQDMLKLKAVPQPKQDQTCPVCETPLAPAKFLAQHLAYNEYFGTITAMVGDKNTAKGYLQTVEDALQSTRETLAGCHVINQKRGAYTQELSELQVKASDIRLVQLEEYISDTKTAKNPYTELYEENTKQMNTLVGQFNALKSKVDEIAKNVTALEFWVQAFGKELKNELLKQVCPFLEQKSNIHLSALGNPQIRVRFQTTKTLKSADEKSEFTVSVESSTGGGTYDALSGGEKQMVNFAVGMALADLAETQVDGPSKLAILDEPFMALDQRNSELVVNYLQTYMAKKKDTILLVSNEESLKMLIPNQVRVIKERGISRLEQ